MKKFLTDKLPPSKDSLQSLSRQGAGEARFPCFTINFERTDNMTIENMIDHYHLNHKVIQKVDDSPYMLIAYDKQHLMMLDIEHPRIIKVNTDWFEERQIQASKKYSFLNKYINPKKLEVQEGIPNIIPLEHTYIDNCGNPDCDTCPLCTLTICKVCGGCEGSLTTECSGENTYQKEEDIYSGKLDFRYGKWRPNICTRTMLWSSDKAIPNEIKYLQELLSENAPPNILKEEYNYIVKWINTEKGRVS